MSTHSPNPKNNRPHHEGRRLRPVSRDRSCQITKAENRGTKKPWEKLGSFHHCPARWVSVGMYSQSNSPAIMAVCHNEGGAGSAAGARAVGGSDCSTWLTETDFIPNEDSSQHKEPRGSPRSQAPTAG